MNYNTQEKFDVQKEDSIMETIQENEYVTRELHDLQLERIELLIERNLSRQEVIAAGMKADIAELKGDVKAN